MEPRYMRFPSPAPHHDLLFNPTCPVHGMGRGMRSRLEGVRPDSPGGRFPAAGGQPGHVLGSQMPSSHPHVLGPSRPSSSVHVLEPSRPTSRGNILGPSGPSSPVHVLEPSRPTSHTHVFGPSMPPSHQHHMGWPQRRNLPYHMDGTPVYSYPAPRPTPDVGCPRFPLEHGSFGTSRSRPGMPQFIHPYCSYHAARPSNSGNGGGGSQWQTGRTMEAACGGSVNYSTCPRQRALDNAAEAQQFENQCLFCGIPFETDEEVAAHPAGDFHCPLCEERFCSEQSLDAHVQSHVHDKKTILCEICGSQFSKLCELKAHYKTHKAGKKPYRCQLCGQRFAHLTNKQRHDSKIHGGWGELETGQIQRKKKTVRDNSKPPCRKHPESHTREKKFSCDVCGKKFLEESQIKRHAWIHTGLKPFECDVCQKRFSRKYNRTKHIQNFHNKKC